jgi:hypothetical protein
MFTSRLTSLLTQLTMAAWILWGSGWSDPPATTTTWRLYARYPTEAACRSALTAQQQAKPQLRGELADRTVLTHPVHLQCQPDGQAPTGQP